MEKFPKLVLIGSLILLIPIAVAAGPYPPAADEPGSTAIWKDDPAFITWASGYENYIVGPEVVSTWKTPEKALGPAVGTSLDIVSLGRGGQITLIFDPPFKNGAGWDFAVFENSFSDVFLELAYVEVSSDGGTFVRFDNDSLTNSPVGGFGAVDPTNVDGYGGKYRQGFGTPFDLDDLATKNEILSGAVKLNAITHVRILDIIGDGSFFDSDGDVIYDPYPTSGSIGFDLDAVGARYEKDGGAPPTEINPPTLLSPVDGAANAALNPTLETGPFSARDLPVENYHARTHWQIARDAAFDGLVADVSSPVSLTSFIVSSSTLEIGSSYFWRAKFIDNDGVESEWADASTFTTTTVSNDLNGNGIRDDQELATTSSVDLNSDGQPDVDQISDQFKVLNSASGSGPVAVEATNPNVVIEYIETLDPAAFPDHDGRKPQQMLFGLMSFRLRVQNAGDLEALTVYLSDPAPAEHEWMKYDAVRGWHSYHDATFNPDRYAVTFTVHDGAGGDSDGLINAVIIDPAGVGGQERSTDGTNIPSSGSAGVDGNSGLGCFISTTAAGFAVAKWEIVRGIAAFIILSCLVFIRMLYLTRHQAFDRHRSSNFNLSKALVMKSSWRLNLVIFAFICCGAPQAGFSKAFTDQLERVVAVPPNPQRIVAFAPSLTEIIYAIGQGHRLVGATVYSNFPAAAQTLSRVGTYVHLDLERIVALKPDLCIATKDGNPRTVIDRLAALNIPVYTVNPSDLKSVGQTILELGAILNASKSAAALVEDINRRVRRVRNLVDGLSDRPKVFFQIGVKPIISVGTDTFIHELIVFAGGRNVAAGSNPYPHYSWEQVIGLSPDVIVITTMARQAVFEQVRKTWHRWSRLPAAKNGRIYLVDSDVFDRPSPRLVDGLEQLAVLLHPQLKKQLQ